MKRKCMIVNDDTIVDFIVRYNGIGTPLTKDETQILLFALVAESTMKNGLARRAENKCNEIWRNERRKR